jgi:cell wall-associated NlpC family hydrolase
MLPGAGERGGAVTRERGQLTIAAAGVLTLLLLGAALLVYLAGVRAAGARGQRAADLAALAAARVLAADPGASPGALRAAAARAAAANGGRLAELRVEGAPGVPSDVDVAVRLTVPGAAPGDGGGQAVLAQARAGVAYSASLPAGAFRPVDLTGVSGRAGVVAAAEAQIGWPYVWGGESRAEGGFDCSGLVDFAFAAAGAPLPGRPTAAELWRMGRPIAAAELQPGDLAFMGSGSGAPYHVALYAGDGLLVVAPHTGARVRFEPQAGGGWDGFARLLPAGPPPAPPSEVEQAARRHQVPPHVLAAVLRLGLADDPEQAARALAAAQRRHPGDLAAALADAVGDPSAAALALRAASGPGLSGFAGAVRLLPEPAAGAAGAASGPRLRGPARPRSGERANGERSPPRPGGGRSSLSRWIGYGVDAADRVAGAVEHDGRVTVGGFAGVRHVSRLGLNLLALAPDRTVSNLATASGAVWDAASGASDAIEGGLSSGLATSGLGLWASRLTAAGGLLTVVTGGLMLATGSTRRRRIMGAVQATGGALQAAGFAAAGTDLMVLGAAGMEVPPVGVALILAGTAITCGVALYQTWPTLSAAGSALVRSAGRGARDVAGRARDAAGAAWDGARALASELPTPW